MYCTNCGVESKDKICKNCGVKQNKTRNFCKFCGNKIDVNCKKCPQCQAPVKDNAIFKIVKIIRFPIAAIFIFMGLVGVFTTQSNFGQYTSITKFIALSVILVIVAAALIVVPIIFSKKHIGKNKSPMITAIVTVVLLLVSIIVWEITLEENKNLNTVRDETEYNAQLEADFEIFVGYIEEEKYNEAIFFAELGDFSSRAKSSSEYSDLYSNYYNYASGMHAYTDEPYNRLSDALIYLNSCEKGFLDTDKHISDIKSIFSKHAGIYLSEDTALPTYLTINENGEYRFCLEEDYKSGATEYANGIYRKWLDTDDGKGWTFVLTGSKLSGDDYSDMDFVVTYDYYLFSTQNTTDFTAIPTEIGSDFGIYAGVYEKISDTPLAEK